MSDFDAARKRLERHAEELSYVAEQDPHYSAEEGLIAGDIRLLLDEVERLEEELRSWHEGDNECCKLRHEAQIAREEALAEVERLKRALRGEGGEVSIQTDAIDAYYVRQKTNEGILTPAEKAERVMQRLEAEAERLKASDEIGKKLLAGRDRQIEKAEAEVERLRARVEAVLKLHKESDSTFAGKPWCSMCKDAQNNHVDWPCATVRALEGK